MTEARAGARAVPVAHRDKVRYLVVGCWNACFAYACFAFLYFLLHDVLVSPAILAGSYAIATVNGYLAFRSFVFEPRRHPLVEYGRYLLVNLPIFGANSIILPLAIAHTSLSAYLIQGLFVVAAAVAAYLGNSLFTFRRSRTENLPSRL